MKETAKKTRSTTKIIVQVLVMLLIFGGLILAVNQLGDFNDLFDRLSNMNTKYLIITIALTISYFIFMILPHFFVAVFQKTKLDKTRIFLNASNEYFFNAVTPMQSGSQPFQSYVYLKHGVTPDETSSILTTTYINYQLIANFLSTLALTYLLFFSPNLLAGKWAIVIVGFTLNFGIVILIIFLTFSQKFPKIAQSFLYLLAKIKPLKKRLTKLADDTPQVVRKFQRSTIEMLKKKRFLIFTTLLRIIALLIFYSIPYFVAKSLNVGIDLNDFLYMMAISLVATTLMAWFPLPGSSGGTEAVFVLLITTVAAISSTEAMSVMFVWRLFTYYFGMIWGLGALALIKLLDRKKNKNIRNYQTRQHENVTNKLKIAILCDNFHDNNEAQDIYQSVIDEGNIAIVLTHTRHESNPANTLYLKFTKLKIIQNFKNNNSLLVSSNLKIIRNQNFDIIHAVNCISHSRLLLKIKKHEPIPILFTDTYTKTIVSNHTKLQQNNILYRLEKLLMIADRVLPKYFNDVVYYYKKGFKPAYYLQPTIFTKQEYNSLTATKHQEIQTNKSFLNRYLLVFSNFELVRFIDFYFGIKDNEELFNESQFIIIGNLKFPKSIVKSLEKNNLLDNFVIINDFANAKDYLFNLKAYIKEEYAALTSIFYIVALANKTNVLLPDSLILPQQFNEIPNIYFYNYANNFREKILEVTKDTSFDTTHVENYFNLSISIRLRNLYEELAKEI